MRKTLSLMLVVSISLTAWIGCSKSSTDQTQPAPQKPSTQPRQATKPPAKLLHPGGATTNHVKQEPPPAPKPSVLEKEYHATSDTDRKTDIISDISDAGTREAVEVLQRLFQAETNTELKVEILSDLSFMDGLDAAKLGIYKLAVKADQPVEVRQEAIDGLSDIEDARAIPLLQELTQDKNPEISDDARNALELVQTSILTDSSPVKALTPAAK